MKIIPITKEIFGNLINKDKLVCSKFIFELPDKYQSFEYYITENGTPFSIIHCLKKYIYDETQIDPLKGAESVEVCLDPWTLTKIGELDKTFFNNSFSMMCTGYEEGSYSSSMENADKPKPAEEGIYELSLPIIGFSKKIWIKFIKFYEWTSWDLTIAYENMIDNSQGFYYSRSMKRDYLNITGGKIYVDKKDNIEKGS